MINATLYEEMTFHVRCDPLSDSPPNNKKTITTPVTTVVYRGSSWQVDLSRFAENLQIGLKWSAQSTYDSFRGNVYCYPPQFLSMYVVHHNRGYSCCPVDTNAFKNKERCQITIAVDQAMWGRMYDFEVILTTQPTLSRTFKIPLSVDPATDEVDESATIVAGPSQAIMKTLLADRHSVDTQFIFTADKTCANVGFWAHRSVLSRYKALDDLIKKSLKEQVVREGEVGPLTIRLEKFSLATFACLVYYIYTGTIKRTIDTRQFAFSQQDEAIVVIKDETTGRTKDRIIWNPLDADSSWKLKDVTWTDLLFISEYFGVYDLRDECIHEVVGSMKTSNVVELLFEVGCFFTKVKIAGLYYLADNLESMIDEGKDPFEKYQDHKECHAMMLDAMRYKSVHVSRRQDPLASTIRSLQICE
ncbi:hypothetical protein F5H01DRAFT_338214 [Linnemannia elongata]|nr:hypothetical protein F5H01DRAFT_338214 [Linnemannia elongata]